MPAPPRIAMLKDAILNLRSYLPGLSLLGVAAMVSCLWPLPPTPKKVGNTPWRRHSPVQAGHSFGGATLDRNVALREAARLGEADMVRALLAQGADPNAKDSLGQTALSMAGEAPMLWVAHGMTTGGTCVTEGRRQGYDEIVQMLLRCGADAGGKNRFGVTPLQQAQGVAKPETMNMLRQASVPGT